MSERICALVAEGRPVATIGGYPYSLCLAYMTTVGAGLPAKDVNDDAGNLNKRGALEFSRANPPLQ